jgi:dipeptidyl aminopeptidase/acylaminoacyl peptidase
MQNGQEIAYSCGQWGAGRRLFRIPVSAASKPALVGSVADDVYFLAISHSSDRLIYTQEGLDWDIWRVQLGRSSTTSSVNARGERFLSSTRVDTNPQYSPDGKKIAFESCRSGNSQIWTADAAGSNAFQLTSVAAPVNGFPRWSPDGQRIAFHSRPAVRADIFVIDSAGGTAQQLTHDSSENMAPSWSQDGRWIYFCSRRSGDSEIWKIPANGGSPVRVTNRGGFVALEAGQFLWYTKEAGRNVSLWKAPLAGGPEVRIVEGLANGSTYSVTPTGVYFIRREEREDFSLQYFEFNTGQIAPLAEIEGTPVLGLTVSPDRLWALYNRMERRESDLMLVENFR